MGNRKTRSANSKKHNKTKSITRKVNSAPSRMQKSISLKKLQKLRRNLDNQLDYLYEIGLEGEPMTNATEKYFKEIDKRVKAAIRHQR